jgi:hemerythrin-like domain-containing protein
VLHRLEQLASLVAQLDDAGHTEALRKLAADICSYFDGPARAHHEAEEQRLFPRLMDHPDTTLVGHVRRLQQEHGWLEDDWLELGPQLQAVARGFSWVDVEALRLGVPAFTQLYREHIALEETIVYPAAKA